jgi:hypothetical protein
MTTKADRSAFNAVVSTWHSEPTCEVIVEDIGERCCTRPATWHWDFHGHSRGIMCTEHMHLWLSAVRLSEDGTCDRCGVTFLDPADSCTFTQL